MSERPQPKRWRCLISGCNPVLDESSANLHKDTTGHRVARWPVRSAEGKRRARMRNKTGYYDKYNAGEKSYGERFGYSDQDDDVEGWDEHKGAM